MLDKIVDAARGFELVEIEGDAAFLSRNVDGLSGPAVLSAINSAAVALHQAFHRERRLIELNLCPCGSCRATNELKLKFVAHVGEVATQTIRRRRKLVGLDVIYVHRLLKNPVAVPEYLLVTDPLFREAGTASDQPAMQEITLDLEGIGEVPAHFVDIQDMAEPLADPSWSARIGGTFAMVGRGLPHIVRRLRPKEVAASS